MIVSLQPGKQLVNSSIVNTKQAQATIFQFSINY